jgi:arginyl-tRNA synthetase
VILPVHRLVRDRVAATVATLYNLPPDDPAIADMSVEVPPKRALGDIAVPIAFALARRLRKAPRVTAQEIAAALGPIDGVTRVDVAPNGYLNLFLDRVQWMRRWTGDPSSVLPPSASAEAPADKPSSDKTIVEHTAINPNKAAHIGHLRNGALGDTLGRVLRFRGTPVEIQNYIDDLGVQVADIVVGFRELERRDLDGVRHIADTTRFDYYCWDLYSRVTEWYEERPDHLESRTRTLHDLEQGAGDAARMGAFIVDRVVRAHLATMARLNISYDLLTHEGDIVRLKFWARAFDILKERGAVYLQTEGKLAGCWVMKIDDGEDGGRSAEDGKADEDKDEEQKEKVIVRSNGVVTYIGKDLANQFWKLGLLGRDFNYRLFGTQGNGHPLWSTTTDGGDPHPPAFGRAARIYNVIDSRQMYLQALLSQALRTLGHTREAGNSIHYSYEMVALSHPTARELGHQVAAGSEEAAKPFVEVSGRKGLGVKIDDLLDLLIDRAGAQVAKRNPEFSDGERMRVASQIAVAAIRYFMLKFSRGKLIVFDMEEALSFEGETGPYLQYAVVRANNIFGKLKEREGMDASAVFAALPGASPDPIADGSDASHDLWGLVLEAARLDEVVEQAVRTLELSVLAKYAFALAQQFNGFYHAYPVLKEERADVRLWRAAAIEYYRRQLTAALELMGCTVPERM